MVHTNKILTVSYGTFSCTLEGFDDSFGTMKAIAEYFRDLAADDRYFGAEPPQPDADMLARIAQREIARRVDAHEESGRIVLRAAETPAKDPAPEPKPAPALAAAAPVVTPKPAPEPAAEAPTEPVAPVAEPQPEPKAEPANAPDTDGAAPADRPTEPVEEIAASTSDAFVLSPDLKATPESDAAHDDEQTEEDVDTTTLASVLAEDPVAEPEILLAEPVEEPDIRSIPPVDSIAAKLQRIRAVVSRNEARQNADYVEDQHAEFFAPASTPATEDLADDIADTPLDDVDEADSLADLFEDSQDDSIDAADAPDVETQVENLAAALSEEAADEAEPDGLTVDLTEEDTPKPDGAEQAEAPDQGAEDDDTLEANLANLLAEAGDDDQDEEDEDLFVDQTAETDEAVRDPEDDIDNTLANDTETAATPSPQVRVVKVKRADLEAAIAAGSLEEVEEDDAPDMDAIVDPTTLSPEAEADLLRELAEVEAELQPEQSDEEMSDQDDTAVQSDDASRTFDSGGAEEDVSRLMDEAGNKLDESASRHEDFDNMRAAIAAAEAEKDAGGSVEPDADGDAYRADLASVVRPRRPEMADTARPRPTQDSRPAPLKLVAEQRVDDMGQRGPVRPRRVAPEVVSENSAGDGGFADFAAAQGAEDLPDLLEAAAAYLSFVEGREHFSRPQLMTKVRDVEPQEFNREDGLRYFGQLLRDGKITKINGGRFEVSDSISYKPEHRAVI